MTQNQIAYQGNLERERSARAQELENNRSNVEREFENRRSNVTNEGETKRSNVAREGENYRSNTTREKENFRTNVANEGIGITRNANDYFLRDIGNQLEKSKQTETKRANERREYIDWELGQKGLIKGALLGGNGILPIGSGGSPSVSKPSTTTVVPSKTSSNGRFQSFPVSAPKAAVVPATLATIAKSVKGISPMFIVKPVLDVFQKQQERFTKPNYGTFQN